VAHQRRRLARVIGVLSRHGRHLLHRGRRLLERGSLLGRTLRERLRRRRHLARRPGHLPGGIGQPAGDPVERARDAARHTYREPGDEDGGGGRCQAGEHQQDDGGVGRRGGLVHLALHPRGDGGEVRDVRGHDRPALVLRQRLGVFGAAVLGQAGDLGEHDAPAVDARVELAQFRDVLVQDQRGGGFRGTRPHLGEHVGDFADARGEGVEVVG
jgi:hypothetical protein